MKHKHSIFLGAAVLMLGACAQKADNIAPSAISVSKYRNYSCDQLIYERSFTEQALSRVSASQNRAAKNDAWMVFLIGVPTSGGGTPEEVARLKGEQNAIQNAMTAKRCF